MNGCILVGLTVRDFYILEGMKIFVSQHMTSFRPSHEKLLDDIIEYQNKFCSSFANAIYDYIIKIVAGELRHGYEYCEEYFTEFDRKFGGSTERDEVYQNINKDFTPHSILEGGTYLFSKSWEENYGGEKWLMIAKAGKMYKKIPDLAFIDHCVDLSHNNSVFFDKGAEIFFIGNKKMYNRMLNYKFNARNIIQLFVNLFNIETGEVFKKENDGLLYSVEGMWFSSFEIYSLFKRMRELFKEDLKYFETLIEEIKIDYFRKDVIGLVHSISVTEYEPIQWVAIKDLSMHTSEGKFDNYINNEDDDDDDWF